MKKQIICICGGGSTYTLPMLKTLCDNYDRFPFSEIRLFDIVEEKQEMIAKAAAIMFQELLKEPVQLISTYQPKEAFTDIDFAFMQIRAGGLQMREQDEKISLRNGCVGQETCGAGGFAYGLRSVTQVCDIIKQIRQYARDAWIINYSNPAAIVAEATKRLFPNDEKLLNICDMPIAMMDGFAKALQTDRHQLSPRYFGLNHFGWFTHLYDQDGVDVLPIIKDKIKDGTIMPEELKHDQDWAETFQQLSFMTKDLNGPIPNTYLQYYLYPQQMVLHSDPNYTRANSVMDHRLKEVERQCAYIINNNSIKDSGLEKGVHGIYIIELAESILHNKGDIFIIITRNNGIISNLSKDAMVEVPCIVTNHGCEPLHIGEIDTFYKALLENQYGYECLSVDAILHQDKDAALKALTLNRTVVNIPVAKTILEELCEANKDYWVLDHE